VNKANAQLQQSPNATDSTICRISSQYFFIKYFFIKKALHGGKSPSCEAHYIYKRGKLSKRTGINAKLLS